MYNGEQPRLDYANWVSTSKFNYLTVKFSFLDCYFSLFRFVSVFLGCQWFDLFVFFFSLTSDDEMCNFYVMYWTHGSEGLNLKQCFSYGPPLFRWSWRVNNIPEHDASTLWNSWFKKKYFPYSLFATGTVSNSLFSLFISLCIHYSCTIFLPFFLIRNNSPVFRYSIPFC